MSGQHVSDDQVAAVRAFLVGDEEEYERLCERPDRPDAQPGFVYMLAAAFCVATARRFGQSPALADIVRFVGSARARLGRRADEVDPGASEQLIHTVLTDPAAVAKLDEATKETQIPLLYELVADEQFDAAGLDAFLDEVRGLADQMVRSGVEGAGR